jgi:outer membrane protein
MLTALLGAAAVISAAPAAAQDNRTDEPRQIKPLFGGSEEKADQPPATESPRTDDEFGGDKRWQPARGLFGLMTFLVPETTNLSIGVGPQYRPDYFGSNDYEIVADPIAFARFRNITFLDDNGADFALIGFSNFRFGPTLRVAGRRDADDNPALRGLGDVGTTLEFGGFAGATFVDRYSVLFKVRQGIATGHRGLIVDANATALLFRYGPVSTSVSAHTAWIGNDFADAYFSVTPAQSAASGLPVYDAKAGFRDMGGSFNAYINVAERWSINPYVSYRYIFDGIADTPIISQLGDRSQFTVGFHVMREFRFGRGARSRLNRD